MSENEEEVPLNKKESDIDTDNRRSNEDAKSSVSILHPHNSCHNHYVDTAI